MRKVIFSIAAAGAALVVATPAAAQYVPRPAYDYSNGWGMARSLQVRIDNIQRQIKWLDRRDRIRDRSADRLRDEAKDIEHRLHKARRHGLNPYEANSLQVRIARLEQRVQFAVNGRNDRYGRYNGRDGHWGRGRDAN